MPFPTALQSRVERLWLSLLCGLLAPMPALAGPAEPATERACTGSQLTPPAVCTLGDGDISFAIQATSGSSLNQLRIRPTGLEVDNSDIVAEIDGSAYRAELADLDANGWPEIYVYVSSAGSGSYGSLVAYAVNRGKSISPIYLPPLDQSSDARAGYMGHDVFSVVENRLERRFPVYRSGDANAQPTGGTRTLRYRLEPGEAGWVLVLDEVTAH